MVSLFTTSALAGNDHSTGMRHDQLREDQQRRIQAHDQILRDQQEGLRRAMQQHTDQQARREFERIVQEERDRIERESLAAITEQKRIKQEQNKSEQAVQELHKSYSDFLSLTREQLIADVENLSKQFISKATRILFRYPEHLPVSKTKFNAEIRRAYKVLFGSVIYIVNPHDLEILGYLVGDGHMTHEELAQMDLIRNSPNPSSRGLRGGSGSFEAFAELSPSSIETQEAWRNIARRFIEDL